jgi:hypothetical protein
VNANSNLRAPIAQAFGFDPFARVVDYLTELIDEAGGTGTVAFQPSILPRSIEGK